MAIRVAINGFGRIGRVFMRRAKGRGIEIVAVNDLGSLENLAYLLKHDTVYGKAPFEVETKGKALVIDGKEITFLSEKDPVHLPWGKLGVDVVVEATGVFDEYEKAKAHLKVGAKRVVITAPGKGEGGETVLMGINEDKLATCPVTSNASCTTNSASPIIAILDESIGIEKAILSTVHAYTSTQSVIDGPVKGGDFRRGRDAAHNIAPSSTGAAIAVAKAYPALVGKFDGIALRVPVIAGSIADITFIAKRATSVEEVNNLLRKAAHNPRWEGLFKVTEEQLVSSDIVGEPVASIADLLMTRVVDDNLVKVLTWYDNEMGYVESLLRHVLKAGEQI
ncbi:type I glyceraldehyde-3-phosphate dehydrogenase [Candidatus Kaiserbacteria bacterium RIFCSPLOWO2_02_FULL_56_11]|uniref:Type I glyceraldehyde-3-phosphate dehydrogenase n=2 Tax=Candidatus Kaiseribacteriota TaxID=1752734 RepID=A0A1F6E244_9BACT|nr:MAG: type I glyceraldehyde-3-phosphate dehydrogenase [Candidatus Kaiserbacteria bacterium RIFCSPHIGHO2_02_FULL_56_30]OGG71964.1 MAG: type I glyceraldehyde-3-phosphate dehydrogenase [Candidatus Kaiserbacteria bacterium RIFCSPHIGHO2_12_FULL_56_13]OGG82391.1 MAG: type I glyceraldehyde-3-phosphate dehydrogenase [Candidatus Kaiserbacteria bacterium RIFCSPLOWO2_02_FULL_56_11]